MRDIPVFVTEFGAASLTLSQIPYTKTAYIRIQDTHEAEDFLRECVNFCKMAGAEMIYATGHSICEKFPFSTAVVSMQADKATIGSTDACIFPVTEKTLEQWRSIYNEKVVRIPNGAWMSMQDSEKMLQQGSGYFVHMDGTLLGIGKAEGNQIQWIASVHPRSGENILKALCHAITEETITLEVASTNEKAMNLYKKLGFIPTNILSDWYRIE